jgi:hypothetical protein
MIRFQPDTLGQALTRFFDMAAPDANVYVEIAAPDIRLAAIVVLALAASLLWGRLGPGRRPTFALVGVLFLSAAIWLATSGNGRYFIAMLVCAGPIAVALVCLLPITRTFKAALALLLVAGQGFVLSQQPPWDAWTLAYWKRAPFFEVRLGPEETRVPAAYISLSVLTYSLIAPQFPPGTRWMSLHAPLSTPMDQQREQAFLRRAMAEGPVNVIAPVVLAAALPDGRPNASMIDAIEKLVALRNLRLSGSCHLIRAPGMVALAQRSHDEHVGDGSRAGFWSCPVAYQLQAVTAAPDTGPPVAVQRAYARLGELCPQYFSSNIKNAFRVGDGWAQHFDSDTRVYVLDNGDVWYKFWRSLNPVRIGTIAALVAGEVTLDCAQIRGRDRAWQTGRQ